MTKYIVKVWEYDCDNGDILYNEKMGIFDSEEKAIEKSNKWLDDMVNEA